jgi:hypothetical protein
LAVPSGVSEWNQFWGAGGTGMARLADGSFDGQSLRKKASSDPRAVGPRDYARKLPPSAARKMADASPEGVIPAQIGPGNAYEAWKNTLEYRDWSRGAGKPPQ